MCVCVCACVTYYPVNLDVSFLPSYISFVYHIMYIYFVVFIFMFVHNKLVYSSSVYRSAYVIGILARFVIQQNNAKNAVWICELFYLAS